MEIGRLHDQDEIGVGEEKEDVDHVAIGKFLGNVEKEDDVDSVTGNAKDEPDDLAEEGVLRQPMPTGSMHSGFGGPWRQRK